MPKYKVEFWRTIKVFEDANVVIEAPSLDAATEYALELSSNGYEPTEVPLDDYRGCKVIGAIAWAEYTRDGLDSGVRRPHPGEWAIKEIEEPAGFIMTAFCKDADGNGTTWIGSITMPHEPEGESAYEEAHALARQACADDWGYSDAGDIICIGLIRGDAAILDWND